MKGVNKATIIGSLGSDPEIRYTTNGSAVCNIRVATNESWTDKQSGEKQERTEWHSIVFFGKLAEIAEKYLKKGSAVYVEGSLRTRKWLDKGGVDRYTTEIVGSEMQMLGGGERRGTENARPERQAEGEFVDDDLDSIPF